MPAVAACTRATASLLKLRCAYWRANQAAAIAFGSTSGNARRVNSDRERERAAPGRPVSRVAAP
jgi:hypothetical protein